MLKRILQYSHDLLEESIIKGETVIDATCGNGNDTLFLSDLVGEQGCVYAFDVQEKAITSTRQLMQENNNKNVSLINDGHELIGQYISEVTIGGAIFNLGYLPKSDKSIITNGESTITAVDTILNLLKQGGVVVLVVYHGHEGGKSEKEALLNHVIHLDQKHYSVLQYGFINQKNDPPFLLAIEKK